jgi:hypothetical protein
MSSKKEKDKEIRESVNITLDETKEGDSTIYKSNQRISARNY